MSSTTPVQKRFLFLARISIPVLLALAAILSRKSADFIDPYGLVFVVGGGVAMALMSFSGRGIRVALSRAVRVGGSADEIRQSTLFWEAAVRNFWMLGIMGSIVSFAIVVAGEYDGIAGIHFAVARCLLTAFYGMVLAVICYVPYWKLAAQPCGPAKEAAGAQQTHGRTESISPGLGNIIGYLLFITIVWSALLKSSPSEMWAAMGWIVYWPSLLVVLGGALALVLFMGGSPAAPTTSMSFAVTGLIGSLMGFIQVLFGFSSKNIAEVSSALTFILSSCFAALLGMILIGAPQEDRAVSAGRLSKPSAFSRIAWYVFPMVALILLLLVFVLVITPIHI